MIQKLLIFLLPLTITACDNLKSEVNNWANKNSLRGPQGNNIPQSSTKITSICPRGSVPETKLSTDSKKMCRTHAGTIFPAADAFQEYYLNGNPKTLLVYSGENLLRVNWHENGRQKEEINYHNNKKEGLWKSWHENGKLKETGIYLSGNRTGTFTVYSEEGDIKEKSEYHLDQKNGLSIVYNSNGKVTSRETFKNGQKNGNSEYFHQETGNLISHGAYLKGYYNGKWINYYQDGSRASFGAYNDKGLKHGEWKYYDSKNAPVRSEFFSNGEVSQKLELKATVPFKGGDILGAKPPEYRPENRFKPKPQPSPQQESKGWKPL